MMIAVKFLLTCWLACCTSVVYSTHPSYITCSDEDSAENGGPVVVYKNATWHQCVNGSLIVEQCINLVNGSYFECVPHESVVKKTKGYLSNPTYAPIVENYFTDESKNFVNCVLLKKEMPTVLGKFKNKNDCTTGMEKLPTSTEDKVENDLCSLKRKVFYMDEVGWYSCNKDRVFQLQKCVIKRNSSYYCVDKTIIEDYLISKGKFDEYQGDEICANFSQNATDVFPEYEEYMESCYNPKSPHPSYITCNDEKYSAENGGPIVVYKNSTLHQCRNGKLVVEQCISLKRGSFFECVPYGNVYKSTRGYMRSQMRSAVKHFFTDKSMTFVDCVSLNKRMPFVWGKFRGVNLTNDCTTGMEKLNVTDGDKVENDLCSLTRKVYSMDDEGWYSCKDGVFQLQKCVIKRDSAYYCVDKKKIEDFLSSSGQLADFATADSGVCTNFSQNAENVFPDYEKHLKACDAEDSPIKPYSGGRKMIAIIKKCKKRGKNMNNIWYKCDMPTKCVVKVDDKKSKCISFRAIEFMFTKYQKAKISPHGAWDDKKFNEIKDKLDAKQRETYEGLESMKNDESQGSLFKSLSELVKEEEGGKKIVTISVMKTKTTVTPYAACEVIKNLAPFNDKYIKKHTKRC